MYTVKPESEYIFLADANYPHFCTEFQHKNPVTGFVIQIGAIDYVSIQNISENYRIDVSRRIANSSDYSQYKQFDVVNIRVANPIFKNGILTGAFAEIAPNVSGILDMSIENYIQTSSTIVQAVITKIDAENKKIKLRLI